MKNRIHILLICCFLHQVTSAQIVNTFPLDDSVGIGTTAPQELFEVFGNARINGATIGVFPLSGLIVGSQVLESNTTGTSNFCLGGQILRYNTTGSQNMGIGGLILDNNISGSGNLGIGQNILNSNYSGEYNIAIAPFGALRFSNGSRNIAIGNSTLDFAYTANDNVAVGDLSMSYMTKALYNTAVGSASMTMVSKGNGNTAVGYSAGPSIPSCNNSTAIGSGTTVDASNKVRIGNASVTSIGGQVGWTIFSDARVKNTIQQNVPGLAFINLLNPVTYHYDIHTQNQIMRVNNQEQIEGMYDIEKIQFTGFIAQEVDAAAKKVNYDFSGLDKSGEILGLRYAEFVVPLVKAVQELDEKVDELEQVKVENAELEKRIAKLEHNISKQGIVLENESIEDIYKQSVTVESDNQAAFLSQNVPNPFTGNTSIAYYVPETAQQAHIKIANANGTSLFMADVRLGNGVLDVDASQLIAGTYSYTLIVDGKVIDTKLMVIQ